MSSPPQMADPRSSVFSSKHAKLDKHAEQKLRCETCGKNFSFLSKLEEHLQVHSKERFYCNQCENRSFQHQRDLVRHQLRHHSATKRKASKSRYPTPSNGQEYRPRILQPTDIDGSASAASKFRPKSKTPNCRVYEDVESDGGNESGSSGSDSQDTDYESSELDSEATEVDFVFEEEVQNGSQPDGDHLNASMLENSGEQAIGNQQSDGELNNYANQPINHSKSIADKNKQQLGQEDLKFKFIRDAPAEMSTRKKMALDQLAKLQKEKEELLKENDELKKMALNQIAKLQREKEELLKENDELKEKKREYEKFQEERETEIERLTGELTEMRNINSLDERALKDAIKGLGNEKHLTSNLTRELTEMRNTSSKLKVNYDGLQSEIQETKVRNSDLEQECQSLKVQHEKALKGAAKELKKEKQLTKKLTCELTEVRNTNFQLKVNYDGLQSQNNQLMGENRTLQKQYNELLLENNHLLKRQLMDLNASGHLPLSGQQQQQLQQQQSPVFMSPTVTLIQSPTSNSLGQQQRQNLQNAMAFQPPNLTYLQQQQQRYNNSSALSQQQQQPVRHLRP